MVAVRSCTALSPHRMSSAVYFVKLRFYYIRVFRVYLRILVIYMIVILYLNILLKILPAIYFSFLKYCVYLLRLSLKCSAYFIFKILRA
jgi:hypothetical protein